MLQNIWEVNRALKKIIENKKANTKNPNVLKIGGILERLIISSTPDANKIAKNCNWKM